MTRITLSIVVAAFATTAFAAPLPVCKGGNRAERQLTCIVDGDTGWERGVNWRMEAIDTPEMKQHAECRREAALAVQARDRLRALMGSGYQIVTAGEAGRYGRQIVTVSLSDGRDAGAVLISEGLAQPWPNEGNRWCGTVR